MSRSPSWIEPSDLAELQALAQEVAGPARFPGEDPAPTSVPTEWGRETGPEPGPSAAQDLERPRSETAESDPPRPQAPVEVPSAVPTSSPPAAVDSVEGRVVLLADWLTQLFAGRPFFVSDGQGLPIWCHHVSADQVVWASALQRALHSLRSLQREGRTASARLRHHDGTSVEVVWRRCELGAFAVGVFGSHPMTEPQLQWIEQALERVFQP